MKNLLIVLSLLMFVSCGIKKRDFNHTPIVTVEDDFLEAEITDSELKQTAIAQNWWSELNDEMLNSLIEEARAHNFDINIAVANFQASRSMLKKSKLEQLPTIGANAEYLRTRLGENIFAPGLNPTYSSYNAGVDSYWEIDVFGRVANQVKATYANHLQVIADMNGVYIRIFAEVADNYLELRGTQYLYEIALRNLKSQEETYDLTVQLYQSGVGNQLDVSRALAQLETTRASIPSIEARMAALKNSLSVLVGRVPNDLNEMFSRQEKFPNLPESIAIGSIHEMLQRRPDIQFAEAALKERIALYNISVADLYPKVQFGGSVGFSAVDFSNFGSKESFTWSIFPNISWAGLNLGRVKQQIDRNDALTIAAVNQYEKTVLQALEEIKTALTNYSYELKRKEILSNSTKASITAATLAKQRFNAGLDSFIDYLNAEKALLDTENLLANSKIISAKSLIEIYKALGGGWELISEDEINQKYDYLKQVSSYDR